MLIPFETLVRKYGKPSGVFHIGASTGQEAKDYYAEGVENVIWIEAIPKVYEQLKTNINYYTKMFAINECIGVTDGFEVKFNISNNEAQSSSMLELGTHKKAHPEVHYVGHLILKTKRVETILNEKKINLADYNFLNIDLQGAELMALESIGKEIDKVQFAYIEVNNDYLYEGCPLIGDIDRFMGDKGFRRAELKWCGNFGWGDAFYTR